MLFFEIECHYSHPTHLLATQQPYEVISTQGNLVFINDPSLVSTGQGNNDFDDVFGQQLTYFNLDDELEYDYPNRAQIK